VPDAVIIGAGPNGLVAANMLVDAGWDVTVLEAEPEAGGAARSGVTAEEGFIHDRFSAFYPLSAASPVIRAMGLDEYGLKWLRHPISVAHPGDRRHRRAALARPRRDVRVARLLRSR
jgi:phytoene dehydrogenase-like protein